MILITYGTRPEYIKVKPLISQFEKDNVPYKILFTGQHKDIACGYYDFKINMVELSENRLDSVIANLMKIPSEVFENITHILVQGDTTSVVGLSLCALHRKINVIHLEAGLRTYDYENPYPEENNRKIVSSIAKIHLCPTKINADNLLNEKVIGDIHIVGNTVLDNLIEYKNKCEYTNKVLVTLHRRENHDKIDIWFRNINELAKKYNNLEFILPIHPNPNVQKHKDMLTNIKVINPLSHEELLEILVKTKLVITDSGGLQEECSFFNKKCLVCRKVTERPESLGTTSFLVSDPNDLNNMFNIHLNSFEVQTDCPYGDGCSSERISKILKKEIFKN